MANVKISNLEEYTGSPIGTYIVVNNSAEDTTYKMLRRNFLRPDSDFRLVYGIFSQSGDSTPISATTVESSLINGGVGTLSVGANQFTVGDSFQGHFGGVLNAGNNQTIQIRVKAGSVVLADSGLQTITNITNDIWELYLQFSVRQIGGAGTASIVTFGKFSYSKTSNGTVEGFAFNSLNNTTFDTTIDNTLDVTVEWGSTNSLNSIYSDIFTLTKIY